MTKLLMVDTSVWIDFFNGRITSAVEKMTQAIEEEIDLYLCGPIKMEILQGIRSDVQFKQIKAELDSLYYLEAREDLFTQSAALYRKLKQKGLTIRKSMDCLIASYAIHYQVSLLHQDRDFDYIAKHSNLNIFS